jgi:hypothetical protein
MHRGIRRQERKSVEDLEAAQRYAATLAKSLEAQGGLMHQLQRQTRFDPHGGLLRPAAEQVPRSQAEMFRDQQPQAPTMMSPILSANRCRTPRSMLSGSPSRLRTTWLVT